MKYRKKPVVVEAVQWTGYNSVQIGKFVKNRFYWGKNYIGDKLLIIQTLEGNMTADINDWIIKGVKGEFYPRKPDIFKATYEKLGKEEI